MSNVTYDLQIASIRTEITVTGSIAKMIHYHCNRGITVYMKVNLPGVPYKIRCKVISTHIVRSAPETVLEVELETCSKEI